MDDRPQLLSAPERPDPTVAEVRAWVHGNVEPDVAGRNGQRRALGPGYSRSFRSEESSGRDTHALAVPDPAALHGLTLLAQTESLA